VIQQTSSSFDIKAKFLKGFSNFYRIVDRVFKSIDFALIGAVPNDQGNTFVSMGGGEHGQKSKGEQVIYLTIRIGSQTPK
jgi:hypothetical protein